MEAMMAGAAIFEIFLASLAIGGLLTAAALRGAFWLMQGAGVGRPSIGGRQIAPPGGALALAPVPLAHARHSR